MFGYMRAADASLGAETVDRVVSLACHVGILLDVVKDSCVGCPVDV